MGRWSGSEKRGDPTFSFRGKRGKNQFIFLTGKGRNRCESRRKRGKKKKGGGGETRFSLREKNQRRMPKKNWGSTTAKFPGKEEGRPARGRKTRVLTANLRKTGKGGGFR